jgi:dTDP-glucose 4,6-dehydratase
MHRNFAVGKFLLDLLENRPITVKGDGTPLRSYLYAADLAIWLWTILFRGNPNAAYNVGSEHAISIGDLAQHVATRGNPSLAVLIQETPNLNEPPSRYIPDTSRARTELGLTQRIALSDAIDRTLKWNGLSVGSRYKGPSR